MGRIGLLIFIFSIDTMDRIDLRVANLSINGFWIINLILKCKINKLLEVA